MVEDGVNGFLVEPRDVDALAAAVGRLLGDPGLASRVGAEGRRRVAERFSLGAMVRRTAALYEELLEEAREPRWSAVLREDP
jgi:glycosyltransferase involved in cell wall biosynthesis